MGDGPEQRERDEEMTQHTFTNETSQYKFLDMRYNADLLEMAVLKDDEKAFEMTGAWDIWQIRLARAASSLRL